MGKRSRFQILETAENSGSDEEDYLPLITTKQAVEPTTGGPMLKRRDKERLAGDRTKYKPKPSRFDLATMRRQQSI